jgi:hypothetical protein
VAAAVVYWCTMSKQSVPVWRPWTRVTNGEFAAFIAGGGYGRGLHSFPFQLNLSFSVHRISQLNSG